VIIFWSLLLTLWLALLAGTFVKTKRSSAAIRWMAAGMLLMAINMIVREVATGHRWPLSQLLVVDSVGLGSSMITLGCISVSVFIMIRSGRWTRRRLPREIADEKALHVGGP
jgi:hypothetical protein